jgi:hypothetical protein
MTLPQTSRRARRADAERAWLAVTAVSVGALSIGSNAMRLGGDLRPMLTVLFFCTVPGLPLALQFVPDRALTVVVMLTASLSISILASTLMVTSGAWHPYLAQVVLFAAVLPRLLRIVRGPPAASAAP